MGHTMPGCLRCLMLVSSKRKGKGTGGVGKFGAWEKGLNRLRLKTADGQI